MADGFDDEMDIEPTISIVDYLKAVEEEELEADLVLGGDEGKECTYNKGYIKRQAVFSCLTCTPDGDAGVCTACSLSCHEGHEIVELWTKRNFRCDCGNSKFGGFFCKLEASKDVENAENKYNHNFKGAYCKCDLTYPDLNVDEPVEMIQCCICEDWFHEEHIGLQSNDKIPRDEEGEPLYEDFICLDCAGVCSFLAFYPQIISTQDPQADNANMWTAAEEEKAISDVDSRSNTCVIGGQVENPHTSCKPLFLSKNWREALCRCAKCIDFYANRGLSFVLDKEDSIAEYERMAKQKRNENMQKLEGMEMSFLNNLGHVEKIEILSGIADMKNEIFAFLQSADPSKPITTADIQQVFDNLAQKRNRSV